MNPAQSLLTRRAWAGLMAGALPGLPLVAGATNAETPAPAAGPLLSAKDFGATGDGTTDDGPALTKAFAAARDAGGILFLPPGAYRSADLLQVAAPCRVFGVGEASAIVFDPNIAAKAPYASLSIEGDPKGPPGSDVVWLVNFALKCGSGGPAGNTAALNSGLGLTRVSGLVEGVVIRRSWGMGLGYHACHDLTIRRCQVIESGRDGITSFWDSKRIWVVENLIQSPGDDGIAFNAGDRAYDPGWAEDLHIVGNQIENGQHFGRGVYLAGVRRVIVAENLINKVVSSGITVEPSLKAASRSSDVDIRSNFVLNAGASPNSNQPLVGIRVNAGDRVRIAGNTVDSPGGQGLFCLQATEVTVMQNVVRRWGQATPAPGLDLRSSTGVIANGNSFADGPGPVVLADGPQGLRLLGNHLEANHGSALTVRGAARDCFVGANNMISRSAAAAAAVTTEGWSGDAVDFVGNVVMGNGGGPTAATRWPQGIHYQRQDQ